MDYWKGAGAAADLWGGQWVNPAVERRLGESVPTGVDRLVFGHQSLGPFDDISHAVDEALLLRREDELVVHLDDTRTVVEEAFRRFTWVKEAKPQSEDTLLQVIAIYVKCK